MKRVLYLRHGRTEWNASGRFQGQADIPLDDVGKLEAQRAATLLAELKPEIILSSDLSRARETASYLATAVGLTPGVDARLRETFAGSWEGSSFAEIDLAFPEESAQWKSGAVDVRPGGGETRAEVGERMVEVVLSAVEDLSNDGLLVVVTHGGAARSGLAKILGLAPESWGILSGLANCHWSVIEERSELAGWRLTEHNAGSLPEPPVQQEG